ncbi:unnamed protein product [Clavelina lepadiformis]|uniref:Palmitoyltransferase n=1 Tax=Clavelina lepadiformis TaxID=159417 RepID=A0ABP0FHX5_CLALP
MCRKNHSMHRDNSFVRTNGWTFPLNCLQIFAAIVILLCGLMLFGVEALALPTQGLPAAYVCIGLLYIIHIASYVAATSINPADDNSIRQFINRSKPIPVFDRSLHKHVIENNYCHICEVAVGEQSKHCSVCNKCVAVFDHHCKWLNNCIGEKNYRMFLLTLLSGTLAAVGMLVVGLYVLVGGVQDFSFLNQGTWWNEANTSSAVQVTFLVFIGVKVFILLVSIVLLGQLFGFHLMLVKNGLTTYEYIKGRLNKKEATKRVKADTVVTPAADSGAVCNDMPEVIETPRSAQNLSSDFLTEVSLPHQTVIVDVQSNGKHGDVMPKHALIKNTSNEKLVNGNGIYRKNPALPSTVSTDEHVINHNLGFTNDENLDAGSPVFIDPNLVSLNNVKEFTDPNHRAHQSAASQKSDQPPPKRRQKKKRKKPSTSLTLEDNPRRPLPPLSTLPESPTSHPLPDLTFTPLKEDENFVSKSDDLIMGSRKGGKKLPPLSAASSLTSLSSLNYSEV